MVFEGTVHEIDHFFHWLSYQPAEGFVGDATLTIETNDLGSGSLQRQLVDTDFLRISVVPVPEYAASPEFETYPGMLDPSFAGDGRHLLSISDGADYIRSMKVLDNGKIVAVGAINGRAAVMQFNTVIFNLTSFGEERGILVLQSHSSSRGSRIFVTGNSMTSVALLWLVIVMLARLYQMVIGTLRFGVNGKTYFTYWELRIIPNGEARL